ncbi:MAG: rod shape-determining protein MreC [Rickettsiales bacterium]|nr:rod shape-determining protein MreC [Rickettsiales bacterium]|tara:strand:- start:2072 stop:2926 length:855 start_codon:yes stop_codon:yes gene_type:complete
MAYSQSTFSKFLKPTFLNYGFIEILISFIISVTILVLSFNYKKENSDLRILLIDYFKPFSSFLIFPFNKFTNILEQIYHITEIQSKNEELISKLEDYETKLNELYHLEIENIELKNLLNLKSPPSSYKVSGRIINDPINFASQNIFIDVGFDDNVKINNPVLNKNGLIGRVIKVEKNSSEVLLLTDPKSNLPVFSLKSNLKFFVNGNLHGFSIKHLEGENKLINGETILSTNSSGYFKEGIQVGKVLIIDDKIYVKPLARKEDSKYIKVLVYDFQKNQPFSHNK